MKDGDIHEQPKDVWTLEIQKYAQFLHLLFLQFIPFANIDYSLLAARPLCTYWTEDRLRSFDSKVPYGKLTDRYPGNLLVRC